MVSATVLLMSSLMVGDWAVRCSAGDAGGHYVYSINSSGTNTGVGHNASSSITMASGTNTPYAPDIDSNGTNYAVVWTAIDQNDSNTRRVYLSVNNGTPIVVGLGTGVDHSPSSFARVAINTSNHIFVAWASSDASGDYKAIAASVIYMQDFLYSSGTLYPSQPITANTTGGGGGYGQPAYNFGDIACDENDHCVVGYVRTNGNGTIPSGTYVKGFTYSGTTTSSSGTPSVNFAESAASYSGGTYGWCEIACYTDGSSVLAYQQGQAPLYAQRFSSTGSAGTVATIVSSEPDPTLDTPGQRYSIACVRGTTGGDYALVWDSQHYSSSETGPFSFENYSSNIFYRKVVGNTPETYYPELTFYDNGYGGYPSAFAPGIGKVDQTYAHWQVDNTSITANQTGTVQ